MCELPQVAAERYLRCPLIETIGPKMLKSILLFLIFAVNHGYSQDMVKLLSINDDQEFDIRIKQDGYHSKATIVLEKDGMSYDSVVIRDVRDCDSINLLQKRFVSFQFNRRAGTGISVRLTKIFCVREHQLVESLFYFSKYKDPEEFSHVSIILSNDLQLTMTHEYRFFSETDTLNNRSYTEMGELQFDRSNCIFTNADTLLNSNLKILGSENSEFFHNFENVRVKRTLLPFCKYIFYNRRWYAFGRGQLFEM